jgi:2-oxoisovalerate dehydrogenase E1 component alpha subunit
MIGRCLSSSLPLCEHSHYPGSNSRFSSVLEECRLPSNPEGGVPVFRILNNDGHVIDSSLDPKIPEGTLLRMYQTMLLVKTADKFLYESQRQMT